MMKKIVRRNTIEKNISIVKSNDTNWYRHLMTIYCHNRKNMPINQETIFYSENKSRSIQIASNMSDQLENDGYIKNKINYQWIIANAYEIKQGMWIKINLTKQRLSINKVSTKVCQCNMAMAIKIILSKIKLKRLLKDSTTPGK